MTIHAVRLSDLIASARLDRARGDQDGVIPAAAARPQAVPPPAGTGIADGLELLAVQLLSLSKTRRHDPRGLMVEALRSIDSCLVAIRPAG
jgi:hypothetical protein